MGPMHVPMQVQERGTYGEGHLHLSVGAAGEGRLRFRANAPGGRGTKATRGRTLGPAHRGAARSAAAAAVAAAGRPGRLRGVPRATLGEVERVVQSMRAGRYGTGNDGC
jgi:hypothetical protein